MPATFTYTPTDPTDAYKATEAYGHTFAPGEAVSIDEKAAKKLNLTVEQIEAKLEGNPEFTKSGGDAEDKKAIADARRQAKEAEAAEKLRAEAAEASAAAQAAGPTA